MSKKFMFGREGCNRGHGFSAAIKLGSLFENRYSFTNPLWFALRHHFFVEKTMSYVILGNERLCHFLTKKDQNFL